MLKIIHNPRCRKSRESLLLLREQNVTIKVIEYLKNPLLKRELEEIISILKIEPEALIRKNEVIYKQYYKGKELSKKEAIEAMIKYPILIERPIILKDGIKEIYLNGRKNLIKRCLINLIDNATNFGNKIKVQQQKIKKNILISVEDNGPGIPESEYDNVLKPFYKIDKSRNQAK